jgi:Fe-S oxidoreductase
MLDTARSYLERTLDELRDDIRAGVPVVGLEPSCVAVFRDELPNLMPHDLDAKRLSAQTFTLAEVLAGQAPEWEPPRLARHALVQVHCHQGAVLGFDAEKELMERMGLDVEMPDAGCCGMAGSFGYEAGEKYDVSAACGERVILPAVRTATEDTIVIADGFSCREQIGQGTERTAVHLAEVVAWALRGVDPRLDPSLPEQLIRPGAGVPRRRHRGVAAAGMTAGLVSALVLATRHQLKRRRDR